MNHRIASLPTNEQERLISITDRNRVWEKKLQLQKQVHKCFRHKQLRGQVANVRKKVPAAFVALPQMSLLQPGATLRCVWSRKWGAWPPETHRTFISEFLAHKWNEWRWAVFQITCFCSYTSAASFSSTSTASCKQTAGDYCENLTPSYLTSHLVIQNVSW